MNFIQLKNIVLLQIFIIYTRYLIGGAFVFASIIKIKGNRFTSESGELAPIHSAFHFFETMYQSGLYWQFLGMGQFVAGMLLMTQRFSLLGALIFLPISANIFVITLSYDFGGTPIITSLILLANIMLVLWEWDRVRVLWNMPLIEIPQNRVENHYIWTYIGFLLFAFTAIYRIIFDYYNMLFWFLVCFLIGFFGFLFWIFKQK